MTSTAENIQNQITPFNSIKYIHYYYFVGMLCLIFLLAFKDFNTIFSDSFAEAGYLSKDTGIWAIAIFLFSRCLDPKKILSRSVTISDLLFMFVVMAFMFVVKAEHSVFIPTMLLISIWFYSARPGSLSTILITWLYLLLSLPYAFYNSIIPQLQSLSVIVLEGLLGWFSIPILVQENYIAIPRGQFEVAEGCSGLKFLSVNLVLLFLYSVLSKFNLKQFFLAFTATVFISLLVNWARILLIIVVAHNWGFEVPYLVKDHASFGWVIYTVFLVPLFFMFLKIDRIQLKSLILFDKSKKVIFKLPPVLLLIPIFSLSII